MRGIEIRVVDDLEGCRAVNDLLASVWEMAPGTHFVPSPMLLVMAHAGNYIVAVSEHGRMVAASMAFLGMEDGRPILHSHVTGVVPDAQGRAVGFALKQHQREWCLARGIETVEWTFDPLVRRNGYFNLEKLGAAVTAYVPNYYGTMHDGINRGDDTDRCLVRWDLLAADVGPDPPDEPAVRAHATTILAVTEDERPQPIGDATTSSAERLLVYVPSDIVALRERDAELAKTWRVAVRETMGCAIQSGYRAHAMTRDGAYVLDRHGGRS